MPSIHINSLCQAAGTLKCITLDSPGASWRCLLSRVSTVRPWSQAFVSTKRGFKVNSIHVAPKTPWPCCIRQHQKAAKTCLKRNLTAGAPKEVHKRMEDDGSGRCEDFWKRPSCCCSKHCPYEDSAPRNYHRCTSKEMLRSSAASSLVDHVLVVRPMSRPRPIFNCVI